MKRQHSPHQGVNDQNTEAEPKKPNVPNQNQGPCTLPTSADFDAATYTYRFLSKYGQNTAIPSSQITWLSSLLQRYYRDRKVAEGASNIPPALLAQMGNLIFPYLTDFRTKRSVSLVCRSFNHQMHQSGAWEHVRTIRITELDSCDDINDKHENMTDENLEKCKNNMGLIMQLHSRDDHQRSQRISIDEPNSVLVLYGINPARHFDVTTIQDLTTRVLPLIDLCTNASTLVLDVLKDEFWTRTQTDTESIQMILRHICERRSPFLSKLRHVRVRLTTPACKEVIPYVAEIFKLAASNNQPLTLDLKSGAAALLAAFVESNMPIPLITSLDIGCNDETLDILWRNRHCLRNCKELEISCHADHESDEKVAQIINETKTTIHKCSVIVHNLHCFVTHLNTAELTNLAELRINWTDPNGLDGRQFVEIMTNLGRCTNLRVLWFLFAYSINETERKTTVTLEQMARGLYWFCVGGYGSNKEQRETRVALNGLRLRVPEDNPYSKGSSFANSDMPVTLVLDALLAQFQDQTVTIDHDDCFLTIALKSNDNCAPSNEYEFGGLDTFCKMKN